MKCFSFLLLLVSSVSFSHPLATTNQTIITDLDSAKAINGTILSSDLQNNLAVTYVTPAQLNQLSRLNHGQNKCAGFEALSEEEMNQPGLVLQNLLILKNRLSLMSPIQLPKIIWNEQYQKLADQADPKSLKETILWISSYPDRYNKGTTPNKHVDDLKGKLQVWMADARWPYTIEIITHKSTRQNSVKLTIPGTKRPNEVVVLGGHFDSINQSFFGNGLAPGADDNASGSSNLIEALKILKQADQPERTLEFYWYAGEESGLLGSAEIAKEARRVNKNVIAALQLDMTLHPGSGEQVVGLVDDFTSPWLREVLTEINNQYVKARFVTDTCGYGCSDHASWFRQGYHAVIPFEATTETMNRHIHTDKDVINNQSSLTHSNTFTKYAVLFALVLGNSDLAAPAN